MCKSGRESQRGQGEILVKAALRVLTKFLLIACNNGLALATLKVGLAATFLLLA